jgi:hypothetical protein
LWRRAVAVSTSEVVAEPSRRVRVIGTGVLANPGLQVLYNFHGECLMLSVQNFLQESCLVLISSALYKFLRTLNRALEISSRPEILHYLTLRFRVLTCFLRAFSFGDHHGTNLVFGGNGGKQLLLIASRL